MEKITFTLRANDAFITLVSLLQLTNVIDSGGAIKSLLSNESIRLNDNIIHERKRKIYAGDIVKIHNNIEITILAHNNDSRCQAL